MTKLWRHKWRQIARFTENRQKNHIYQKKTCFWTFFSIKWFFYILLLYKFSQCTVMTSYIKLVVCMYVCVCVSVFMFTIISATRGHSFMKFSFLAYNWPASNMEESDFQIFNYLGGLSPPSVKSTFPLAISLFVNRFSKIRYLRKAYHCFFLLWPKYLLVS